MKLQSLQYIGTALLVAWFLYELWKLATGREEASPWEIFWRSTFARDRVRRMAKAT